jgi:hypothetical protein
MTGVQGLRCPECGRVGKSEQSLFRRRRPGWSVRGVVGLVLLGVGLAAWPVFRDGRHWRYWGTDRLIAVMSGAAQTPQESWHRYLNEVLYRRPLTVREYDSLVLEVARVYVDPRRIERADDIPYGLSSFRLTVDGRLTHSGPRGFVWHVSQLKEDANAALSKGTAVALLNGLYTQWRLTDDRGALWSRGMTELAFSHPAVAEVMLDRLEAGEEGWTVYMVHPCSAGGHAMERLLADLEQSDPWRQGRAAACLYNFYFEVTTHVKPSGKLQWVLRRYPPLRQLQELADPCGDALLRKVVEGDERTASVAAKDLCQQKLLFQAQVRALKKHLGKLDAEGAAAVRETEDELDRLEEMRQKRGQ